MGGSEKKPFASSLVHDTFERPRTAAAAPGKVTLVEQLQRKMSAAPAGTERFSYSSAVQRKAAAPADASQAVHAAAERGIAGGSTALPYADQIQRAFGHHDIGNIQAHTDGAAADSAGAMGAQAFATGDHVAFAGTPDLHTAAHEAAHVVQQRGGVQLKGGVGEVGDAYERHADQVAARVVAGESAQDLLDQHAPASRGSSGGSAGGNGPVQHFKAACIDLHDLEIGSGGVALIPADVTSGRKLDVSYSKEGRLEFLCL